MTTGQMSMNSMPGVMQLIAPEPAVMAAVTNTTQQGEQAPTDGFSTIFSEKRTALDTEKPSDTHETEPAEATVSATEQQIMTAFAAAAQMNMAAVPLPTASEHDAANMARQENDSVQNVPVMTTALPRSDNNAAAVAPPKQDMLQDTPPSQPVTQQHLSGRTPAVTNLSNQAAATVQNAQTPQTADNSSATTAAAQRSEQELQLAAEQAQQATVGRTPGHSVQVKSAATPASDSLKDRVQVTAESIPGAAETAAASEPAKTAPLPGAVAWQRLQAAYQAKQTSSPISSTQPSVQNVPSPLATEQASVVPVSATTSEPKTVESPPHTEAQSPGEKDLRTLSEQHQKTDSRMLQGTGQQENDSAAVQNNQNEVIHPLTSSATPINSEFVKMAVTGSNPGQNEEMVTAASKPAEVMSAASLSKSAPAVSVSADTTARAATNARQQAVPVTLTDAAARTAETAQPAAQPLQQDSETPHVAAQATHDEKDTGRKSLSESTESTVRASESLTATQTARQLEQTATASAEQTELSAASVADTRSTLGQRTLRATAAVQHDQKIVVENIQPRAPQTASVKEMTTMLQNSVPAGEATNSESSLGRDGEQTGSNQQSSNQGLTQSLFTQQKTEHQLATAAKVSAEPARPELPEQIAQQVRERLTQHDLKPGHQQISLTLSPDNLGEVKMNLTLQGQRLTVEIVTDNRIARDAIMQHADTLKETLARQNITMESFDVTTGGKGSGSNQGQNQNAWQELAKQQQQQQLWTNSPRGYTTAQADLPSGAAAYQSQKGRSMLDIHY